MARVAVVGGGIGGLGLPLMLGRRGHTVTLFEQDGRQAGEDLNRDFFEWKRPRVPQANQPHSFLAPVRTVLRTETPDVYTDLLARGAREYHDFDWFGEHPPHRAGDEELVTLRTRRIVLEAALTTAVGREPTVEVKRGCRVQALTFGEGRPARVTGVRAGTAIHQADLVVDASGRRSPVPTWLTEAGCRPPVVDSHRAGIAYLCRWYRLRANGPRDPGRVKTGSAAPFALAGVREGHSVDRAAKPSRASDTFRRRVFWLLPHDRDTEPDGLYAKSAPAAAGVADIDAVGVPGDGIAVGVKVENSAAAALAVGQVFEDGAAGEALTGAGTADRGPAGNAHPPSYLRRGPPLRAMLHTGLPSDVASGVVFGVAGRIRRLLHKPSSEAMCRVVALLTSPQLPLFPHRRRTSRGMGAGCGRAAASGIGLGVC